MLVSLDIETKCNVAGCSGKGCEHALQPQYAAISVVGLYYYRYPVNQTFRVFRSLSELQIALNELGDYQLLGHKLQFDLKMLAHHGVTIPVDRWQDDTQLMAALSTNKVTPAYLREYEAMRAALNEELPHGYSHRKGSLHSLKVLAPFFLDVEPFWEDPTNHDNDEYLRKDVQYSYELRAVLEEQLRDQGLWDFYQTKLMPWARMLLEAELEGIPLDIDLVKEMQTESEAKAAVAKAALDEYWGEAYQARRDALTLELDEKYTDMARVAVDKMVKPTEAKIAATMSRYAKLKKDAIDRADFSFNLDSPTQLSWLLRDYYGLDIHGFDGDESTGKSVLQRLAGEGRKDIETFLEYRKYQKRATAFFPSYLELQHNGILRCTFNPDGARTGRLSSNSPNLQQVPGELHRLFVAPPGMLLNSSDESAIEARLIAYYTEDPALCEVVMSGVDFHGFNVINAYFPELKAQGITPAMVKAESGAGQRFYIHRKMAKELGYALFYGAGADRIREVAQKYGFRWTKADCMLKLQNFKRTYRGVFQFKDELDAKAERGEIIKGLFGRGHAYPDRRQVAMTAFNTLVQGSASDLVLNSGWRIRNRFRDAGIKGGPRLFVHDEIVSVFETARQADAEAIIHKAMTDYDLPTAFGPIRLEIESKTDTYWAK